MNKCIRLLERSQIILASVFLLIFFLVIMLQIFTRYIGISVIWTEEVANYSFIWAVFMGASVMVNRREHFSFDLLVRKLEGKSKLMLKVVNDLLLIVFNSIIFLLGMQVVLEFWNYTWATLPNLKMGYIWLSVPVMAGTMVIYSVAHFVNHIRKWQAKEVV